MTINLYLAHETEKAYGFKKEQKKSASEKTDNLIWFPKSQAKLITSEDSQDGLLPLCSVEVADWLIEKNELGDSKAEASKQKAAPAKEVRKLLPKDETEDHEGEEYDDIPF
jgi:hypothetical protein